MATSEPLKFSGEIKLIGINPYVEVPVEISQALNKSGHIPVKGRLNETSIRATLVPTGGGRHRLYVNGDMRKQAKVKVGDVIELELEIDSEPRVLPIPEPLQKALEGNPRAKAIFDKLPPSHRNEYLAYLNYLKTPEALERNAQKVIKHLLEKGKGAG